MSVKGWVERPLGELLTLEYGAGLPQAMRTGEGYPVYGSSGLVGRHSDYLVQGAGIVVGRKGTVGAVVWSDEAFWPIDTAYYVQLRDTVDFRWLYWQLSNLPLDRLDSSTGVPGLNRHDAYALRVMVPPPPEQRRIAEILDAADGAIQQTERLIAKLKAIKVGLLHDLLTRGLDEHDRIRDPQAHPEQFKDSPLGRIPKEWKIQPLKNLCDLLNGLAFKPEDWSEFGLPIIRIQNLNRGMDFNYFDGIVPGAYIITPGTILFSWSGNRGTSFGPFIWHGPTGVLNQHIFKVTPRTAVRTRWLFYALDDVRMRAERAAHGGSGLVHVRRGDLLDYLVATPPEREQGFIEETLDTHDARIHAEEVALEKLRQIKRGLMDDLLTGKVRVPV